MDSPQDRDIKLQRASADLIQEARSKLIPLLWKSGSIGNNDAHDRRAHRLAQARKAFKLIDLLKPFQEWPQLLDPYLQEILSNLVDAFLEYLTVHRDQYVLASSIASVQERSDVGALIPLPRAICMLLYTLCKIRGVKVISRFLNNEPKYLEVMLRAFIEWDSGAPTAEAAPTETAGTKSQPKSLIWEERYVMLLWLSHLLLAPFDLASISSESLPVPYDNLSVVPNLSPDIPRVSLSILSICLKYVVLPGKEREAATVLLARLALRVDMQRLGLLSSLMRWALDVLHPKADGTAPPVYACIGVLSFIARLGVSGQVDDLAPFIEQIFNGILHISEGQSPLAMTITSSASARKSTIKILRAITTLVISLEESSGNYQIPQDTVSMILENGIDYFLVSLADKDTPVRFAASKALSMITVRLDPNMASDVVEAVLGSLNENILYEKQDGTLITPFEARNVDIKLRKRNISAVDPQRWQGLILTLAHLLFRRSPPPALLPQVLQSLVSGLDFEQRSSTGSSIGTGVRDSACFGIWALSRKYTTSELQDLDAQELKVTTKQEDGRTLQALAIELVCAACLDPSGNIRRGASAALQELVGRHPDTIYEGISLVQAVDYHSVARRSRAMIEVAKGASDIGVVYWNPLVNGLLQWRGIGSPDAESRRVAARALGDLSVQESYKSLSAVLERLVQQLSTTPLQAIEARHGIFLSLAATIDAFIKHRKYGGAKNCSSEYSNQFVAQINCLWGLVFDSAMTPTSEILTDPTLRPDLTAEASARLISSLARSCSPDEQQNDIHPTLSHPSLRLQDRAIEVLLLCMFRPDDIPVEASSQAASDLFTLLPDSKKYEVVQKWFSNIEDSWRLVTGRGQIAALGAVFKRMPKSGEGRQFIIDRLVDCTGAEEKIAKRSSAVHCLATGVLPEIDNVESIAGHLNTFLNDYTTDRRGDIGSFIRLEAIEAVNVILESKVPHGTAPLYMKNLMSCVARLAAEKLDKVRFHAWKCLQTFWETSTDLPRLTRKYEHFSEVSGEDYFLQLFDLLQVAWFRPALSRGLVTSATSGTEVVVRSARFALLQYINKQDEKQRNNICVKLIEDWLSILESDNDDDRYAIPAVEMIAFLLDNCFVHSSPDPNINYQKLFVSVQKFHFKSANMSRMEAAIKIYALLWRMDVIKGDAMKKLTGMLLHPYPKIRTTAADCLYMETRVEKMKDEDWSSPPKQLKAKVDNLRTVLGATP
ncbi:hypothetical protein AJ78_00896 [Emergomyces pasteurianus Ep9510]|uniref:Uncharacterized protein n=1 Tax=Emergomyces pasteurianus Ep9510 TaxID=1447872 RepID=A0A1J9PS97_9EURO|nr:hypothetical protein AJ78_00896 [Emergomyces pasteurianus Ep9510]